MLGTDTSERVAMILPRALERVKRALAPIPTPFG